MNLANRTIFSIAVIALASIAAIAWSLSLLSDASEEADRAAADTGSARTIVQRIESLRPAGAKEAAQETLGTQLPHLLDDAMKAADIDADNLTRISPQPARPFGDAVIGSADGVKEMPVQLVFRQLQLRQLLTLLTTLLQSSNGLSIRNLHLSVPPDNVDSGTKTAWNVELTISYLAASLHGSAQPSAALAD